jgi:hypothetical protein
MQGVVRNSATHGWLDNMYDGRKFQRRDGRERLGYNLMGRSCPSHGTETIMVLLIWPGILVDDILLPVLARARATSTLVAVASSTIPCCRTRRVSESVDHLLIHFILLATSVPGRYRFVR